MVLTLCLILCCYGNKQSILVINCAKGQLEVYMQEAVCMYLLESIQFYFYRCVCVCVCQDVQADIQHGRSHLPSHSFNSFEGNLPDMTFVMRYKNMTEMKVSLWNNVPITL